MQGPDRKPTPALVFDSSMKDEIGQVLALTMLLGYESKREFRLTSLSISSNNLRIAAFCDLMSRFFGATPSIGMTTSGASTTNVPPMLQAVLGKRTPDDTPTYVRTIGKLERHGRSCGAYPERAHSAAGSELHCGSGGSAGKSSRPARTARKQAAHPEEGSDADPRRAAQ